MAGTPKKARCFQDEIVLQLVRTFEPSVVSQMFIPRWIDKERQNPPLRNVKLLDSFVKLSKHFVYHILANLLVNVLRTVFSDHADFLGMIRGMKTP